MDVRGTRGIYAQRRWDQRDFDHHLQAARGHSRPRAVQVRIYDLAGRLVAHLPVFKARSGAFIQEWDGRDEQDALVQPGTYVYELTLDSEEQHTQRGVFAVAY